MKPIAKWIALAFALLLATPVLAQLQDRRNDRGDYLYERRDSREAAFRAGYDNGYREGRHQADYDLRHGLRPDNRYREYDREDGYYGYHSRNDGEYRKGFRRGYGEGYNDAFRMHRRNRRY